MKETEAIIERVKRINTETQHLELAVDEAFHKIKPGQSLLARIDQTSWNPYLRQQWWPVNVTEGKQLVIARPRTEDYQPGQVVSVLGLIGQPYRFRRSLRNVLLIAYDTSPTPLLMTIPWLLGNNISTTMVLLGSANDFTTAHLPTDVEIIRGDSEDDTLSWHNQVMTVGWADQVFVVVNADDEVTRFSEIVERFRELRAEIPKNYLFGVFQPTLPCGAGACHACVIRTRKGAPLNCVDGPAFDLTEVVLA